MLMEKFIEWTLVKYSVSLHIMLDNDNKSLKNKLSWFEEANFMKVRYYSLEWTNELFNNINI